MANTEIKFRKYNQKDDLLNDNAANEATFSVIRTTECNKNDNNMRTGNIKDLFLGSTKMTDVYNSRKGFDDPELRTTVEVGGIPAGTKLSDLTNMSLGEVIDKMLFKTFYPTHTNPSLTITGPSGDYLVGSSYPAISGYTPNRGKYNEYNNNLSYAGDVVSGSLTGNNINGGVVGISDILIRASISFSAGPTPKDSDGNNYTNSGNNIPYSGGTVNSNTLTIKPYFKWFATGSYVSNENSQAPDDFYTTNKPLNEMTVVTHMGIDNITVIVDLGGGDIENKHTIKVPGTIVSDSVKVFKEGTWKNYAWDEWYEDTGVDNTIHSGKSYHVYKMKDSAYVDGAVGGTRLKFTVRP